MAVITYLAQRSLAREILACTWPIFIRDFSIEKQDQSHLILMIWIMLTFGQNWTTATLIGIREIAMLDFTAGVTISKSAL
jgi:hypothetical protein